MQQVQGELQQKVSQLSFDDRMRLQQMMMMSMSTQERELVQQQQILQIQQQLERLSPGNVW